MICSSPVNLEYLIRICLYLFEFVIAYTKAASLW